MFLSFMMDSPETGRTSLLSAFVLGDLNEPEPLVDAPIKLSLLLTDFPVFIEEEKCTLSLSEVVPEPSNSAYLRVTGTIRCNAPLTSVMEPTKTITLDTLAFTVKGLVSNE